MPVTEVYTGKLTIKQVGIPEAVKGIDALQQAGERLKKTFSGLKISMPKMSGDIGLRGIEKSLSSTQATARKTGKIIADSMDNAAASSVRLQSLTKEFDNIRAAGGAADITLQDRFRGLSLALTTSGSRLQGVREVIAGTSSSTNLLTRAFDLAIRSTNELGRLDQQLSRSLVDIANSADLAARGLRSQGSVFRQIIKEDLGGASTAAEGFNKQVTRVDAALKQVVVSARSGGDISRPLIRARQEIEGLRNEYTILRERGIIQAGTASDTAFKKMIADAETQASKLQAMNSRYQGTKKRMDDVKEAQAKQGKEGERQINIFGRINLSLKNMFNVFRSGQSGVQNTTNAMREMEPAISKAGQAMEVFKGAFLGTFAANILSNITFLLQDVFRSLGREFISLNDTIQNTNITIENMLAGSRVNAEAAIAGFTAFVEEQVAATPFEFADAIDASLRLVQQGFDPQQWFRPAANAAAAMNKPMEQFIGGMTKLMSGAKGAAVDMFRDFGLNVNAVSGLFNKATGEAITFEEAQKTLGMSTEEIAAQYDVMNFEFDKQGSLVNSTGDALKILNAYLNQNATFAKAAEARSQSLSGVISNMKDAISKVLIAVGQPIFERLTTSATGLLGAIDVMLPKIISVATAIGNVLANGITFAINAISNFSSITDMISVPFDHISTLINSVLQGQWPEAWGNVQVIVVEALNGVIDFLADFGSAAFEWGANFVVEIANGIFETANSLLVEAMNYIGDIMSSFLAPGSPPEKGPLSEIDEWGRGVMGEFYDSMGAADIKGVTDALKPVGEALKESLGKEGAGAFRSIRDDYLSIVAGIHETGEIDESAFANIRKELEKADATQAKMLERQLRASLASQKANKKIADVKKEIEEAEKKGFVPASLKAKLAAAEQEAQQAEDNIERENELMKLYKLDEEIFSDSADSRAASASAARAAGVAGAKKAAKKEKKTYIQAYQEELAALEQKYALGAISEEEYLKGLLRAEEKFVDQSIKAGVVSGLDEHIAKIDELKGKLEAFKPAKKAGAALGEAYKPPSVEEIFGNFAKDMPQKLAEVGQEGAKELVAAIKVETAGGIETLKNTVKSKFLGLFKSITDSLKNIITPQNLPVVAAIGGFLASITAPSIIGGIASLAGWLFRFGAILLRLGALGAAFTGIGLVITAIILNWDKILPVLTAAWENLSRYFSIFIDKAGGIESVSERLGKLKDDLLDIGKRLGKALMDALYDVVVNWDFSGAWEKLVEAFGGVDFSGVLSTGASFLGPLGETITLAISNIRQKLLGLIPPELLAKVEQIKAAFRAFFEEGRLGGELLRLFESLKEFFAVAGPGIIFTLKTIGIAIGLVIAIVADLALSFIQAFADALPFIERAIAGVIRVITGFVDFFTGIVLLIRAAWAAITGDSTQASALFQQGLQNLSQAVSNIFAGIFEFITAAGMGIVTFVGSMIANMVSNVLMFIPGFEGMADQINTIKDTIISHFLGMVDSVIEIINGLGTNGAAVLEQFWTLLTTRPKEAVDMVIGFFADLYNQLIGNSIIPDMVNGIIDWISTLPEKLLTLGAEVIQSFINGIKNNFDLEGIKSLIGSIFGGGEEAAGGGSNPLESLTNSAPVLADTFDAVFKTIQAGWLTLMADMTTAWSTFRLAMLEAWITTHETMTITNQTFITNLGTIWQTFLTKFTMMWMTAIEQISQAFQEFGNLVMGILREILAVLMEIIATIEQIAGAFDGLADAAGNATDAVGDLNDALEDTEVLMKNLITYANRLAAKIQDSLSGLQQAAGGAGIPTAQHGEWRTTEGLRYVHDNELIAPPKLAESMRNLLTNLKGLNIGGISFAPNIDTASLSTIRANASRLANTPPLERLGGLNPEFHTIIYGQEDEELLRQKVVDWIRDEFAWV